MAVIKLTEKGCGLSCMHRARVRGVRRTVAHGQVSKQTFQSLLCPSIRGADGPLHVCTSHDSSHDSMSPCTEA